MFLNREKYWYFISIISAVSAICQKGRYYRYSPTKIVCFNITTNNIEENVGSLSSSGRYNFFFENSSIQNLQMDAFSSFNKGTIFSIHINNSEIETIQSGAFSGLLELNEINLKSNALTVISRGCFNSLFKLKVLDLSYNNIHMIEDEAFNGSNELQEIFLNENNISYIPNKLFYSLKQLQYLNLSNNQISTFDLLFSRYAKLNIWLNNNRISDIKCETSQSNFYYAVDFGNNSLSAVNGSCLSNVTRQVKLNHNLINTVSNLKLLKELEYLDLSENYISNIDDDTFENLTKIEKLELQKNNFNELKPGLFKDMKSLTLLNLSGNSLKSLEFGIFSGLEKLNNLDLSYNQLEVLEEDVFHNLNRLKVLNVSYNNLQYINLVKLKSYSGYFEQIDLIGNNISCQKLASMFSYKLNIKIAHNVFRNISNINGVPCTNFNLFKNNESKTSGNIFEDIKLFFETDFKNTSFFKVFGSDNTNITTKDNKNVGINLNFQKYLNNKETVIQDEFEQLTSQLYKNNNIFIFLCLIVSCLCILMLVIIVMFRNFMKPKEPVSEPEIHLL